MVAKEFIEKPKRGPPAISSWNNLQVTNLKKKHARRAEDVLSRIKNNGKKLCIRILFYESL